MEPEEVAAAFEELHTSGKVRYFGVSNQNTMQMELLSRYVSEPLMADQLQFGAAHASMIASGVEAVSYTHLWDSRMETGRRFT